MANLIRYCKLTEDHVGDNAFDVSRAGILGNPYTHIKDRDTKAQIKVKDRETAIKMYERYFDLMMESNDPKAKPFQREFNKMVDAFKKFDVVYIGCYCHLNETCHGDFIIRRIRQAAVKDTIGNLARKYREQQTINEGSLQKTDCYLTTQSDSQDSDK